MPHPDDVLVSDWWSKYYHCIGADARLERLFRERKLPKLMVSSFTSYIRRLRTINFPERS